jgi:GNAT superfamily N-acetyltransferase
MKYLKRFNESLGTPKIDNITTNRDKLFIMEMVAEEFKHLMSKEDSYLYLKEVVDWDLSVKLILDNKIIGCYLLAERSINEYTNDFIGQKGIEGVALVLDKNYRNLGYGKLLIEYSESLPYHYIWGQHLKTTGNLEYWKKHRPFVYDAGGYWITAKKLN